MKKSVLGIAVLFSVGVMLTGCGDEKKEAPKNDAKPAAQAVSIDLTGAKDGTFSADSAEHPQLGHSHVELTIAGGAITKVVHTGFDKDGKVKDENYGADKPEGVRKKAQNAYKAIGSYASQLESKKDLAKVDAIAGATVSYDQFNEAVAKAVEAAKK
ncbi:FMN-binding protein [Selenomonas dianae]|nr:FMN-binding protein [Selenomonas dianae]WLD83062.1 FMN-binding protein [Selenomonas dianae]